MNKENKYKERFKIFENIFKDIKINNIGTIYIFYDIKENPFSCNGFLISNNLVLTTYHIIDKQIIKDINNIIFALNDNIYSIVWSYSILDYYNTLNYDTGFYLSRYKELLLSKINIFMNNNENNFDNSNFDILILKIKEKINFKINYFKFTNYDNILKLIINNNYNCFLYGIKNDKINIIKLILNKDQIKKYFDINNINNNHKEPQFEDEEKEEYIYFGNEERYMKSYYQLLNFNFIINFKYDESMLSLTNGLSGSPILIYHNYEFYVIGIYIQGNEYKFIGILLI